MPRDGKESDFRRVLYGMAATFDVRSSNIEGGRAEDVATGEILEDRVLPGRMGVFATAL
jgi:hypothetical protein